MRPRRRTAAVEIVASEVYEFCVSIRVAFASPDDDFTDFDVGPQWVAAARAKCAAHDAHALDALGLYLGNDRRAALGGTLLSLVARSPEPRTVARFLEWLASYPANQLVEMLLDQEGHGDEWHDTLAAALAAPDDEARLRAVLKDYDRDQHPTVRAVLRDPEATRRQVVAGLRGWYEAVFKQEIPRVMPMVERERDALERLRRERPRDFVDLAMHGVQWERPVAGRIIFAPSYFSRPAVFYHFWDDVLTFCPPVDDARLDATDQEHEPDAPDPEVLRFFEALGDRTRLRILRLLGERELYLTQLADRLDLTKATTKFHMVKLRAAGLVTLHDRGRHTFYETRADIARHARELLTSYLGMPRPPAAPADAPKE
jgi:DNA-binding transcriptional ArsR family regulator